MAAVTFCVPRRRSGPSAEASTSLTRTFALQIAAWSQVGRPSPQRLSGGPQYNSAGSATRCLSIVNSQASESRSSRSTGLRRPVRSHRATVHAPAAAWPGRALEDGLPGGHGASWVANPPAGSGPFRPPTVVPARRSTSSSGPARPGAALARKPSTRLLVGAATPLEHDIPSAVHDVPQSEKSFARGVTRSSPGRTGPDARACPRGSPRVTMSVFRVTGSSSTPLDARPVRGFAPVSRCGEMMRAVISRESR